MKHAQSTYLLAALLVTAGAVNAERTFKWIDDQGNVHYGDRVPMQAVTQHREEINEQGRTLKEYPKSSSAEEIAQQKRRAMLEKEKQQQEEEQARRDRELLASYASEKDILIARESELGNIEEFIRMTKIRIESLRNRLVELNGEVKGYEQRGKPVPEFIQQQMTQINDQIIKNEQIITAKQAEMEKLGNRYATEIARYQELQNRKTPSH